MTVPLKCWYAAVRQSKFQCPIPNLYLTSLESSDCNEFDLLKDVSS